MAFILAGRDELFGRWAAKRVDHMQNVEGFGEYKAVGIMDAEDVDAKLMAVIIYHGYVPEYKTCQISGVAVDPRWASKATIRAVLAVPFLQYHCNKVWTATPHKNERVVQFNLAIGFTKEAVLRDHFGPGNHAVICRMIKQQYHRKYIPKDWEKAA